MKWIKMPVPLPKPSRPYTDTEAIATLAVDAHQNDGDITESSRFYAAMWGWGWRRADALVRQKRQHLNACHQRAGAFRRDKNDSTPTAQTTAQTTQRKPTPPQALSNNTTALTTALTTAQREESLDSLESVCSAEATHPQTGERELSLRDIYRLKKAGKQ